MIKQKCVAFIFARGGSKGLPRKNIKMLGGKPLIAHSIQTALESEFVDRVIVSTDDKEIAEIAKEYGAEVPFIRPSELASDSSSEFAAWQHAIAEYENIYKENIDIFVSLPPTSPLRSTQDVDKCIQKYLGLQSDVIVTVKEASRSPYFNMLRHDEMGYAHIVNQTEGGQLYTRRQDVPTVFDMTTVAYVSSSKYILNNQSLFSGSVQTVLIPDERAIDIDTLIDFEFAEYLYEKSQGSKE